MLSSRFEVARAAKYRASLGRIEWDRRHFLAASALGFNVNAVTLTGRASMFDSVESLVLLFFTRLTAFRRIGKAFGLIKSLFSGRPDKLLPAIYALDRSIVEADL